MLWVVVCIGGVCSLDVRPGGCVWLAVVGFKYERGLIIIYIR